MWLLLYPSTELRKWFFLWWFQVTGNHAYLLYEIYCNAGSVSKIILASVMLRIFTPSASSWQNYTVFVSLLFWTSSELLTQLIWASGANQSDYEPRFSLCYRQDHHTDGRLNCSPILSFHSLSLSLSLSLALSQAHVQRFLLSHIYFKRHTSNNNDKYWLHSF